MLIDVRNLAHRIGERTILDLRAFTADTGEHTLILGPSGSGKTTFINMVTGLKTPTQARCASSANASPPCRPRAATP